MSQCAQHSFEKCPTCNPKQIFSARDFESKWEEHWVHGHDGTCTDPLVGISLEGAAELANAKLQSLGIDAETPEKLKMLSDKANHFTENSLRGLLEKAEKRLAELERMIAEAPVVYGGKQQDGTDNWRFHQDGTCFPWDITHSARLIDIKELK